ncbi:MAG: hypothetical protein H7Z39_10185 [Burkholderiaceae bacterium]|nr:hypothetical protein [Burkholderiaceae bacterium]
MTPTKPLSALPKPLWPLLALALAAQLLWHAAQPPAAIQMRALPAPPSLATLRLLSLGEPIALSKSMMLYLQSYDDQPGIKLALARLDYGAVQAWLARMLELDPRGQYPLLAASEVYAAVADPARVRQMLDFVHLRFQDDPDRRWPWLAHAALVARHRLHDLPLARRYAQDIRLRANGADVPAWAREMEAFILEDMDELDSARLLIGALLRSGQISDPHELRFLSERLDQIAARQGEKERETGREDGPNRAAHEP